MLYFRDHYSKRFPELDSLVPTPLEYIRTIKELGNDLEKYKNNEVLQEVYISVTFFAEFKSFYFYLFAVHALSSHRCLRKVTAP